MLSHTGDSALTENFERRAASCELQAASCELRAARSKFDVTEELRVPWCVSISDCHEHTNEVAPVMVTPYSFQSCRKADCKMQ